MPPQCKITILKTDVNKEFANEYCKNEVTACPLFKEGQEFIAGFEKPEGFCDWAWNDIYRFVAVLLSGGNFSNEHFEGWMKDDKTMIACCTDAIRPVTFKIERID
ncbi:MAG: TIGR04076 family protein [Methanobacteriaceae archaeon]|nr:TIGR04076 family protein [Methanobacteriaceae archaeon]